MPFPVCEGLSGDNSVVCPLMNYPCRSLQALRAACLMFLKPFEVSNRHFILFRMRRVILPGTPG
jgi:hypothetical protein